MKSSLKVVTTPMCAEILKIAGVTEYIVTKDPDSVNADIAVILSESELSTESIKIKLNTFSQITQSIELISTTFGTDCEIKDIIFSKKDKNRKIKVKVYSNFLKEIVEDMGFKIVKEDYDFVVYPDYMKDNINEMEDNIKTVEIPSHKNVPLNPIKRAEMRYNILEKELCMKP
jgi:segregation and condensation protein B